MGMTEGLAGSTLYTSDPIDNYAGTACVSLRDIMNRPDVATTQIIRNVQNNALNFAISATIFEFGQRFTRRMLRRPINKINQMVFTGKQAPLRGMGVRL